MKMESARTAWIGYAAVLALGVAALVALNQTGGIDMAERPDDGNGAERKTVSATGNENQSTAEVPVPDSEVNDSGDLPIHHDGRERDETKVSKNHEAPTMGNVTPNASEASQSRRPMAVRNDKLDGVPEEHPVSAATRPPGIQLAPDVRLPVAALPIDFKTNEVTARMLDIIVSDYYRDLAAGVTGDGNEDRATLIEEGGEQTIIVSNGPEAEAARHRADWRFRTIFGKDAFNRMSMQSNLEARLPVTDGQ
jgi:hypothetical protein